MDVFEDIFHLYLYKSECFKRPLKRYKNSHLLLQQWWCSVPRMGVGSPWTSRTFVVRTQPEILRAKNLNDKMYEGLEFKKKKSIIRNLEKFLT